MKKKLKKILLILITLIIMISAENVYASVSTEIKAGGEKLVYNYETMANQNQARTAIFKYSDEYPGGLLVLNNYNGETIEINHIVGQGTVESNPKTLVIKLEGDNKIQSDGIAISSNINFNIIGTGTLETTAPKLHNDEVNVLIEENIKIKLSTTDEENINETETQKEEVNNMENQLNETLITIALITFIILCVSGSILIIININKNLKK